MKEVMSKSDTIRYRMFDVIIDSSLVSGQALEFAESNGFITQILEVYGSIQIRPILTRFGQEK